MDKNGNRIWISDLNAYLEEKISNNDYSDLEYGLYIEIKNQGKRVLKLTEYSSLVLGLKEEMLSYFNDF